MIYENEIDPRLRYEGFLRTAFDCERKADPFGYAHRDDFDNFDPEPNLTGKRALSAAFVKLIFDHKDSEHVKKLVALDDRVWSATKKGQIIEIIDEGFQVLKQLEDENS